MTFQSWPEQVLVLKKLQQNSPKEQKAAAAWPNFELSKPKPCLPAELQPGALLSAPGCSLLQHENTAARAAMKSESGFLSSHGMPFELGNMDIFLITCSI